MDTKWSQYRSISQLKRDTVFLNVYKDNILYGRVGRLISETSAEIVNDISPSATLFYQGVGRASMKSWEISWVKHKIFVFH